MNERIRLQVDCDGLRAPYEGSEAVYRFAAGSELPLLRADDRRYYKVAYGGAPVYVPKEAGLLVDGAAAGEALAVAGPAGPAPPSGPPMPALPSPAAPARPRGWFGTLLRVVFTVIGLGMVIGALTMIISAAPSVISADRPFSPQADVSTGYGLGIGGGFLGAFGLGFIWLAFRPLYQFIVVLSGIVLAIGGIELLIFSIPLGEMSPRDLDPDRARRALATAGAATAAVGLALIVLAVWRWAANARSRGRWPEIARWSAVVYGGLLVLSGPGAGASVAARSEEFVPTVQDGALIGAGISLSLVPGALLLFHGATMSGRSGARPFRFPAAAWLLAVSGAAIALGAAVVAVEEPLIWLMPAAHAGAALLPALALIAVASRGGFGWARPADGLSHRQLGLAFAVGVIVVTMAAGTLDGLIAQALTTGLLAGNGAFDGLRSSRLGDVLSDPERYLSDGQMIALLLIVVVAMAPIMEEGFKALGVALVLPRKPTPSAALMLGVAVGAGFGVFEASVYGLGALNSSGAVDWWALMLVRAGATSMHALNTGMLGLALYYGRAEGRFSRAFLLYLAAVALHALWNGMAVLAGTRVIFSFHDLTDRQLAALAFGVLAPLALGTLGLLYALARNAYEASPKVVKERLLPLPALEAPLV